jgi:hypothetical protein
MAIAKISAGNDAAIWERVIEFEPELTPTAARALLKLQFSPRDRERMQKLSTKARAGTLTAEEELTMDTYERLGCLLDILHSKARRALKR